MSTASESPFAFDGVICLGGEDWWYHNRGHFDFQIMRRIARTLPVLFVNSIGVRMPALSDGRVFVKRIGRKLRSLRNGLTHIENGFWVFSPLNMPGAVGQRISNWALTPQIRMAAARVGIKRPLVWVHCPAGADVVDRLGPAAVVLQRTDRFEDFPEGDPRRLRAQIEHLKRTADLVIYSAPHLEREEAHQVRRHMLVTHGVDLAAFAAAGSARNDPPDLARMPRPRVGFIGGIDAHTFDPALFLETARRLPGHQFVLVGNSSLPHGWCNLPNVRWIGARRYEEVPAIMAAMDVLIMPWNQSTWIQACNPIKLKEYLAVGRPIVTRYFPALDEWRDLVHVADTPDAFARSIMAATHERVDHAKVLGRLRSEPWDGKAELILGAFVELSRIKSEERRRARQGRRAGPLEPRRAA